MIRKYCHRCGSVQPKDHRHRAPDLRPSPAKRGYGAEHRRDREMYLSAFPICQWHDGCLAEATELDHVDGDPFNRDWSNYRGYCKSHHSQRTAKDQPGGWNSPGYVRTYDET